jgi:hypothetical protein
VLDPVSMKPKFSVSVVVKAFGCHMVVTKAPYCPTHLVSE